MFPISRVRFAALSPKPVFAAPRPFQRATVPLLAQPATDSVRFGASPDLIPEAQLDRLMAVATTLIETYIDTHYDANPRNSNVSTIIAGPFRQVLSEPVDPESQDPRTPTFASVWTPEQKEYFKQHLKNQVPVITSAFKQRETERNQEVREAFKPIAQAEIEKIYAHADDTHRVGFDKVYADVVQQLQLPQGLTRGAQDRLETTLKNTLWVVAKKHIPGLPDTRVGLSKKLQVFSSKAYLEKEAEARKAPKVLRHAKPKASAVQSAEDESEGPLPAKITPLALPPAYSTLELPETDLALLMGSAPKAKAKKDRLVELRHELPHALVLHLENHEEPKVTGVRLTAGQPPSLRYAGGETWQPLAGCREVRLEEIQAIHPAKLRGREELKAMLKLMPTWVSASIAVLPQASQDKIQDVHLVYGQPVSYSTLDKPVNRISGRAVSLQDVAKVRENITAQGGEFNIQERYTPEGAMSRISRRPYEDGSDIGFTFSIGRPLVGCYEPLHALIPSEGNILVLGAPGSGKTSFLRDLLRRLSEEHNVELVDPSGEVAGNGKVPHHVGSTHVNYVPRTGVDGKPLNLQQYFLAITDKIYNMLQNLRAGVIARDEVRDGREAEAILSAGTRGVRIVATAHAGNFAEFVHNQAMLNMTGKRASAALKDGNSVSKGNGKVPTFRVEPCPFKTVIVLNKAKDGSGWQAQVIENPDSEIDRILQEDARRVTPF